VVLEPSVGGQAADGGVGRPTVVAASFRCNVDAGRATRPGHVPPPGATGRQDELYMA
jgi:hypothetical protein